LTVAHLVANGRVVGDVHRTASPQRRREQSFDDGRRRFHPAARQSSLPDLAEPDQVAAAAVNQGFQPTVTEPPRRRASGYHSDSVVRRRGRRHGGQVAFVEDEDSAQSTAVTRYSTADPRYDGSSRPGRRQRSVYQALMEADDLTAEQVNP